MVTLPIFTAALAAALLFLFLVFNWLSALCRPHAGRLPPGPLPWPIIGNLPVLATPRSHRTLAKLSEQYKSPLISLWLGSNIYAVVACTADMAHEFLHSHDALFCDRPRVGMVNLLFSDTQSVIGFENSGPRWRFLRKLWTSQLLSQAMLGKNQHIRQEEVVSMLASIKAEAESSSSVNVLNCLVHVTGNIMGRLVMSQRFFDSLHRPHELYTLISSTVQLMFTPLVGDFVPLFSWVDIRTKKEMVTTRMQVEKLFGRLVDKRLETRSTEQNAESHDIIDVLLDEAGGVPDAKFRGFMYDTMLVKNLT